MAETPGSPKNAAGQTDTSAGESTPPGHQFSRGNIKYYAKFAAKQAYELASQAPMVLGPEGAALSIANREIVAQAGLAIERHQSYAKLDKYEGHLAKTGNKNQPPDFVPDEVIIGLREHSRQKDMVHTVQALNVMEADNVAREDKLSHQLEGFEVRRNQALAALGMPTEPIDIQAQPVSHLPDTLPDFPMRSKRKSEEMKLELKQMGQMALPIDESSGVDINLDDRKRELDTKTAGMPEVDRLEYRNRFVTDVIKNWDHAATPDKQLAVSLLQDRYEDIKKENDRLVDAQIALTGYPKLGNASNPGSDITAGETQTYAQNVEHLEAIAAAIQQGTVVGKKGTDSQSGPVATPTAPVTSSKVRTPPF